MINQPDLVSTSRYKTFARATSVFLTLVGTLVLMGWVLNIPILTSGLPGSVTMKANTAFAFILTGITLWLLLKGVTTQPAHQAIQFLAFIIAMLGLLTLCEYIFGWQLGIDTWLFKGFVSSAGNITDVR